MLCFMQNVLSCATPNELIDPLVGRRASGGWVWTSNHLRFLDSLSRCQESRWLDICLSAQLNWCGRIHRGHWVFVWVSTTLVRPYYMLRPRMRRQNHRPADLCTKFFFSFASTYSTGKRGSMRRKSFMIGSSDPQQPTGLDEDFASVVIQHVTVWGLLLATALN